jgi:type III secretion protein L
MSNPRAPLNRPTVLALAGVESLRRVIPAKRVAELERIAGQAVSAGDLVEQAEKRCLDGLDRLSHAAWQRGFSTGHAQALGRLQDFLAAVDARRKAVDAELIGLVMDAVRKIVRRLPPALLTENIVEAALAEAADEHGRVVLRVHPERVAVAESVLSRASAQENRRLHVLVEADSAMALDDCTVETPSGAIEAGLQVQLEALCAALKAGHA